MALPKASITQTNGGSSRVSAGDDGLALLVTTGVLPGAVDWALGDDLMLGSLADLVELGIDETYDTDNDILIYQPVFDFYREAGSGSILHLQVNAQTNTMADLVDKTKAFAKTILAANLGKIKLVGVTRNPAPGYEAENDNGLDNDVFTAVANAQALRNDEAQYFRYASFILEGRQFSGDPDTILDLRDAADGPNANRVSIMIGADPTISARGFQATDHAQVGLLLGRLAREGVQRSPARVKSGRAGTTAAEVFNDPNAAGITAAGFSNGSALADYTDAQLDTLHDKGYIFFRSFPRRAGYYFSSGNTACPLTDDYPDIMSGRPMDKVSILINQVYTNDLEDDFDLDADTGTLSPSVAKHFQGSGEVAVTDNMLPNPTTGDNELSGIAILVDPAQDVQTTNELNVDVTLVKKGRAGTIKNTLTYKTSLTE